MDMPDLRPIDSIRPGRARLVQVAVAAFILLTFLFVLFANIEEWR